MIFCFASAAVAVAASAVGPLRVHAANPRYFTDGTSNADGSERVVYLTGSHIWNNFKDMGATNPPPPFDYPRYLDLLRSNNHNFVRLWTWELTKYNHLINEAISGHRAGFCAPFPWLRTGPGTALDGGPRFDLERFDPAYFDRLRARVIAAGEYGMYVSIMLFEGHGLHSSDDATRWTGHPMHAGNNVNGIDGDPDGDGYGIEIQSLPDPAGVNAIQKAYMRQVIDTVNDLDNVLYEIVNESGGYSTQWQYDMIETIKSHEAGRPKQHPVGMTYQWAPQWPGPGTNEALMDSPADWISPHHSAGYWDDPPPATGGKVIIADTDHINSTTADYRWVWRAFLRGLNPILMDWDSDGEPQPMWAWTQIRQVMGRSRRYADEMNLAAMTPRGDLASTGYALANPGLEYLVYQPGAAGRLTVELLPGTYSVEWRDGRDGTSYTAPPIGVTASGPWGFAPPSGFSEEVLLYVRAMTARAAE